MHTSMSDSVFNNISTRGGIDSLNSLPSTELVEVLQLSHRSYLPIKLTSMPAVLPLVVSLLVPLLLLEEYLSFSPTFIFISFPYESIHLRGIAS